MLIKAFTFAAISAGLCSFKPTFGSQKKNLYGILQQLDRVHYLNQPVNVLPF